jgi:hypothetical protein
LTFTAGNGGDTGTGFGGAGGGVAVTLGSGGGGDDSGTDGSFIVKAGSRGNAINIFALQTSAGANLLSVTPTGGLIGTASSSFAGHLKVSEGSLLASSTSAFTGLATFYGGFVSGASSTVAGPLYAGGPISASSSLAVKDLAKFDGGFIAGASSTVAATFKVGEQGQLLASSTSAFGGLANFFGGFVSTASSSINNTFTSVGLFRNTGGTIINSASSTLLGIAQTSFNSGAFNLIQLAENAVQFATTTVGGAGQYPILTLGATTTGRLDFARVAVGTTTSSNGAGLRDQFYVSGRINQSWASYIQDFMATGWVASGGQSSDQSDLVGGLAFDEDVDCGLDSNATNFGSGNTGTGVMRIRAGNTDITAGDGCIVGTLMNSILASHNPIFETKIWVQHTNQNGYVGFDSSIAQNRDAGATTTTGSLVQFKFNNDGNWHAVVKNAGAAGSNETFADTGVSASDAFHVLRLELTATEALFFIDGKLRAVKFDEYSVKHCRNRASASKTRKFFCKPIVGFF